MGNEDLLAAIYASPADDAARLVYADALTEQGDPRGEFITIQVARARGSATDAQVRREWELSTGKKQLAAWAGPLWNAGRCSFSRGFPDQLFIANGIEHLINEPSVRVLTAVNGLTGSGGALEAENAFLASDGIRGADGVASLSAAHLGALPFDAPWPRVNISERSSGAIDFSRLKRVRELTVAALSTVPSRPLAAMVHLESLSVNSSVLPRYLEGIAPIQKCFIGLGNVNGDELAPLRALHRLRNVFVHEPSVIHHFTADFFEGLTLEQATMCRGDAPGLIKGMPTLTTLAFTAKDTVGLAHEYLMNPPREMQRVSFGPLQIRRAFSKTGLARLDADPWFLRPEGARHLEAACKAMSTECVQHIDVIVPRCDPKDPSSLKPTERILALIRQHTRVPAELRWQ